MKLHKTLLVFICMISVTSMFAQKPFSTRDTVIKEMQYIHGLTMAPNDSLIGYGVSSFRVVVVDRAYKQVARFYLTGMWGGGGVCFSNDSRHAMYFSYGESDTLTVYNLHTKKKLTHVEDNIENIRGYHLSGKVLLVDKSAVSVFSLKKKKVVKTKKFNDYVSDVILSKDDETAFVIFSDGNVVAYDPENWKRKENLASFDERVSEVHIDESHFIGKDGEKVIFIDRKNKKKANVNTGFSYICDITKLGERMAVIGREPYVFIYNFDSKKTEKLELEISEVGAFSLLQLPDRGVLVGDAKNIYLYTTK